MKKAKYAARVKMKPNPSALEGIPVHDPHREFARKDAEFKRRRGAHF